MAIDRMPRMRPRNSGNVVFNITVSINTWVDENAIPVSSKIDRDR